MKLFGGLHVTNGTVVLLKGFSVVVPMNRHRESVPDKHAEEHSPNFFWLVKIHESLMWYGIVMQNIRTFDTAQLIAGDSYLGIHDRTSQDFFHIGSIDF